MSDKDTATQNDAGKDANGSQNGSPTVVVDPALLSDAGTKDAKADASAASGPAVPPTAPMDAVPDLQTPAAAPVASPPPAASADGGSKGGDTTEKIEVPMHDTFRGVKKYGFIAALGLVLALIVGVAFKLAGNSGATPASVPAGTGRSVPVPGALPEVRQPAPSAVDATRCDPRNIRLDGNTIVFTNCATLEFPTPAAPPAAR